MNYTVENLEKSMAKVTITVDADKFEEAMQKSYLKNKKNITVISVSAPASDADCSKGRIDR